MPRRSDFDDELNNVLSRCLSDVEKEELRRLLENAKAAAKGVEIYSRDRGFASYSTIKAALALATSVWKEEKKRSEPGQE